MTTRWRPARITNGQVRLRSLSHSTPGDRSQAVGSGRGRSSVRRIGREVGVLPLTLPVDSARPFVLE